MRPPKIPNVFGQPSNPFYIHLLQMNNFHLPSLTNSLASFFYQKIVSLKDSIALKLQGSPTPFDFDLPHSGEVLSDFTPVTLAEVSQLLRSMSNKSSPLDYIPTSLLKSCSGTFSILISHLANLSFTQATFASKFKLALISPRGGSRGGPGGPDPPLFIPLKKSWRKKRRKRKKKRQKKEIEKMRNNRWK